MCEMNLIGQADVKKYVQFTVTGTRVCKKICKKCIAKIKEQNNDRKSLKVALMESYCDVIDKETANISNLANQCVCVYRIRDYLWQTVIIYKFYVNDEGFVKIQSN